MSCCLFRLQHTCRHSLDRKDVCAQDPSSFRTPRDPRQPARLPAASGPPRRQTTFLPLFSSPNSLKLNFCLRCLQSRLAGHAGLIRPTMEKILRIFQSHGILEPDFRCGRGDLQGNLECELLGSDFFCPEDHFKYTAIERVCIAVVKQPFRFLGRAVSNR